MVVNVEQIKETGLTLDELVPVGQLESALEGKDIAGKETGKDTGFRLRAPARLFAHFRKVSGGVLLNGKVVAEVIAPCKRCLVDVKLDVPVTFTLNLVSERTLAAELSRDDEKDGGEGESGASFDPQSADQEAFDGKTIDLDPIVREQVLLALPMDAVCREDCKGLCPMCGTNRNEKQCSCEEKRVDPRFAALKDIKLN